MFMYLIRGSRPFRSEFTFHIRPYRLEDGTWEPDESVQQRALQQAATLKDLGWRITDQIRLPFEPPRKPLR